MTKTLKEIWRFPIKSYSREALESVNVTENEMLPFDRNWAVCHEKSKFSESDPSWVPCVNFLRGAIHANAVTVRSAFHQDENKIGLENDQKMISIDLSDPIARGNLVEFVNAIEPPMRATKIVELPHRGFSDTDFPSISLLNFASLRALSQMAGVEISHMRWRGNLWLDGADAWEEFDWVGKSLKIGDAIFEVVEPIERCKMTTTNPETGIRDLDTLKLLRDNYGHQNFGVYLRATNSGHIKRGDTLDVVA